MTKCLGLQNKLLFKEYIGIVYDLNACLQVACDKRSRSQCCFSVLASEGLCLTPCLICQRASVCPDIALIDAAVRCHICSVDKLLNKQGSWPPPTSSSRALFVCQVKAPLWQAFCSGIFVRAWLVNLICIVCHEDTVVLRLCREFVTASISSLSFISLFAHFHRARRQSWDPLSVGSVMILLGVVESHPRAATFIQMLKKELGGTEHGVLRLHRGGCTCFALGFLVEVERGSLCFA